MIDLRTAKEEIDQKALESAIVAAMQHIKRDGNDEGDVYDAVLSAVRAYLNALPKLPGEGNQLAIAAQAYLDAVKWLGEIVDGKTLFEHSPSKHQEAFEAWINLDTTGKALKHAISDERAPSAPSTPTNAEATREVVAFQTGDEVEKTGGDYSFAGKIVAAFAKLSGKLRYVVEDDRGALHIYSAKNLAKSKGHEHG